MKGKTKTEKGLIEINWRQNFYNMFALLYNGKARDNVTTF